MLDSDSPLTRGSACLECRRKKHKCDGAQPACTACRRVNSSCHYERTDQQSTATALQARLDRLEQRLQDLTPSDSTMAGPSRASYRTNQAPFPQEMQGSWWKPDTLPSAIHDYLIDIFNKHCHSVHSYWHLPTFKYRKAMADRSVQPHPGFTNAIYLLACYFSSVYESIPALSLQKYESIFLAKAQTALADALAIPDRLMDFIRGSCLIATYLISRGRYLEGYHVHCGTARLALSCGLHTISSHQPFNPLQGPSSQGTAYLLPDPETPIEVAERLLAFWQVVWWDRVCATVLGFTTTLPGGVGYGTGSITSVFPRDLAEYENLDGQVIESETLKNLFLPTSATSTRGKTLPRNMDSEFTVQLKAISLLDHAKQLAIRHRSRPDSNTLSALKALHLATNRFADDLPPIAGSGVGVASLAILSARTMTLGAVIELNDAVAGDPEAYQARLSAAGYIASLAFHFGSDDHVRKASLPTGYCWCLSAQVLVEHVGKVKRASSSTSRSSTMSLAECESQLTRILSALEILGAVFPTLVSQAQKPRSVMID